MEKSSAIHNRERNFISYKIENKFMLTSKYKRVIIIDEFANKSLDHIISIKSNKKELNHYLNLISISNIDNIDYNIFSESVSTQGIKFDMDIFVNPVSEIIILEITNSFNSGYEKQPIKFRARIVLSFIDTELFIDKLVNENE